MAKKLKVKDLRISFGTVSGRVQAVRGISFDLEEGETLAIVGESGSGKSVTSKAILGILAGNATVEGGEIIYDGKDLLRLSEEELHKIRGDKISMIFQDPLSSLNPIVKIGKQLTEAMLLKGKAGRRASRAAFNRYLSLLKKEMIRTLAAGDAERARRLSLMCKSFDRFEFKHTELERRYNEAHGSAIEAVAQIDEILFLIEKNASQRSSGRVREAIELAKRAISPYVVSGEDARALTASCDRIGALGRRYDEGVCAEEMPRIKEILESAIALEPPNFFSLGYYLTFADEPLPELPVGELNTYLRRYLDDSFMLEFIGNTRAALEHSARAHDEAKEAAVTELREMLTLIDSAEGGSRLKNGILALVETVKRSIDPLEIEKDSTAYTFEVGIRSALDAYISETERNTPRRRIRRGNALRVRDGDAPDGEVKPVTNNAPDGEVKPETNNTPDGELKPEPNNTPDGELKPVTDDAELARNNLKSILRRLLTHYERLLSARGERDFDKMAVAVIDFLKQNASGVVERVSRRMAKHRAIKLMEEVGITEPRKRYGQYPFEFSGGMRQRIVIAIALAANPDILICDEPTTALDVTIQAQILELINRLKRERNLSVIFITHDLGVVANMADKIAVMYAGKIVERGTAEEVFYDPRHPYTWALLASMPDLDTSEKLEAIPGTPPNMIYPPVGDAFARRNRYALKIDYELEPPEFRVSDTHRASTWLLHPNAPRVEMPNIISERIAKMRDREGGAFDE